jgi:hypothetical protein
LSEQFLKLGPDSNAFEAAPSSTKVCLLELNTPMDVFYNDFKSVATLTILAARMVDPTDEQQVLRSLRIETRSFFRSLERAKRGTSFIMGECAQDALTVSKAQQLLRIYDRASTLVMGIIRKMGDNGAL